jgi:hypothetical protein
VGQHTHVRRWRWLGEGLDKYIHVAGSTVHAAYNNDNEKNNNKRNPVYSRRISFSWPDLLSCSQTLYKKKKNSCLLKAV